MATKKTTTKKQAEPAVAPESHSVLSPSGAARWLACAPSALMESLEPDTSSAASALGTEAHECAARRLNGLDAPAKDAEMERHVSAYVRYVRTAFEEACAKDSLASLHVESRVDLRPWIPDGYGTADALILSDGTLHVIDLKYGDGVRVEAAENPQIMAYALGAMGLYDGLCYQVRQVAMSIFQPRMDNVSTYTMAAEDLRRWGDEVLRPGALRASKGEGNLVNGGHCKFCKVRSRCKAWHADWDRIVELRNSHLAGDADVARVVRQFPDIENWAKRLIGEATGAAMNGKRYEGLKLVEGRSRRTVIDPEGLVRALVDNKVARREELFNTELKTITELERLAGKKTFNDLSLPYVAKTPGAPKLVDIADPGEEFSPAAAVEQQFEQFFDK